MKHEPNYILILRVLNDPQMLLDMRQYAPTDAPEAEAALRRYIDLDEWGKDFEALERRWLIEDDPAMKDLSHPVNAGILEAIKCANADLPEHIRLFYFYDIDRSEEVGRQPFQWTKSPLSGQPLTNLGAAYSSQNRLVSFDDWLAMPDVAAEPVTVAA